MARTTSRIDEEDSTIVAVKDNEDIAKEEKTTEQEKPMKRKEGIHKWTLTMYNQL